MVHFQAMYQCLRTSAAFKHAEADAKEKCSLPLCPVKASVATRDECAAKTAAHIMQVA